MNRLLGRHTILAASLLLLMLSGCGERLLPVKGKVTLNGQPLPTGHGHIWFVPDLAKGATHTRYCICQLSPAGEFELSTEGKDGVPLGWYKVVIYATRTEPPSSPLGWTPDWIVPEKYTKAETTDLNVEVIANPEPGRYDFDLKSTP
jgi:hypothetical protein